MKAKVTMKSLLNDALSTNEEYMLSQSDLERFQQALLGIYKDVFDVCEKHDLKLFLQGGTLLGKVRHDGFIPWDDDMDLGMSRLDYDALINIFDTELGDRYILKAPHSKNGAVCRFIHIYKIDSYLETIDSRPDVPKKISIDIFPIDYSSNIKTSRIIRGVICNGIMFISSSKEFVQFCTSDIKEQLMQTRNGKINYYARRVVASLFCWASIQSIYNLADRVASNIRETNYCTSSMGRKHYLGEMQQASVFFPLKRTTFCGASAWTINKPEIYLRHNYGEHYMEIPIEEKREKHFVKKLVV